MAHKALHVIEREVWRCQTVLEIVSPADNVRVGGSFCWRAINSRVRIRSIAPRHIRPTHPDNVCVLVDLVGIGEKTR